MKQFIYFAQAGDAIKIGITVDLRNRLSELQVGSFIEINYVHTMPSNKIEEQQLHEKFNKYKIRGEWYKAEPILKYLGITPTTYVRLSKIKSEEQMDAAWNKKMEGEVDRLIIEHRNRFK